MNETTLPSSIRVGIDTSSAFLHSCRTFTSCGSTSNAAATLRSCSRTFSNGFSLRCDSGAPSAVTGRLLSGCRLYDWLLDREGQGDAHRLPRQDRPRDDLKPIRPRRQPCPLRVAAGDAEGEPPRQHVTEAPDDAEPTAVAADEPDLDARDRLDLRQAA